MTYVPPDRMNAAQALERFVRETQGGNLYDLDEEAQDRAVRPIRDMLITGQLEAWLFQEEDGHQVAVPGHRWAGRKIWEDASVGIMTTIEIDGQWVTGRVLVSRAQLEDILKDLSQISSASAPATPKPSYVPPFIRYMLELVERFDLEPGYKFDRDRMADWISRNSDGLPMTGVRAKYMATFLGDPRFERGGGHKWSSPGRPADPCATYNGTIYPKLSRKS